MSYTPMMNPMLVDPMAAGFIPLTLESRLVTAMNGALETHQFESALFWRAWIQSGQELDVIKSILERLVHRGLVESQRVHDDERGWHNCYRLNRNYCPHPVRPPMRVRLSALAERMSSGKS